MSGVSQNKAQNAAVAGCASGAYVQLQSGSVGAMVAGCAVGAAAAAFLELSRDLTPRPEDVRLPTHPDKAGSADTWALHSAQLNAAERIQPRS